MKKQSKSQKVAANPDQTDICPACGGSGVGSCSCIACSGRGRIPKKPPKELSERCLHTTEVADGSIQVERDSGQNTSDLADSPPRDMFNADPKDVTSVSGDTPKRSNQLPEQDVTPPPLQESFNDLDCSDFTAEQVERILKWQRRAIPAIRARARAEGARAELEYIKNMAWDNSGDGSKLGVAYELVVQDRLAALDKQESDK